MHKSHNKSSWFCLRALKCLVQFNFAQSVVLDKNARPYEDLGDPIRLYRILIILTRKKTGGSFVRLVLAAAVAQSCNNERSLLPLWVMYDKHLNIVRPNRMK